MPDKKCSTPSLDPPRSVIHVAEEVVTIANEPTPPKLLHEDPVNSQYGKNELFHCNHFTVTDLVNSCVTPLFRRPQGSQGCLEKQNHPLSWNLVVWCAKIGPKS